MAVLTQQQRNTLESAVRQARRVSETGALNALRAMAVDNPEPFPHMNPEQRSLRNRLRSKARLLGDELPSSGHQQIDRLTYELAYEYWHKMLFAKFLEANGLLMHPDGVSVTMDECEELAKGEGFTDKWDIAASFASKMLPAIFRPEDPLMQISFAPDDRIKLEEILEGLDNYIFTADDALGWVYQFWQSDAKDAINKSGDKIDGKKLPAVTQLFTEPYMVHFLIDNTIGAWWVSRNPGIKPPVKFEYLRFLEDSTPAAGRFEGWPDRTAEITALDPCMGSGHFVISLFNVLVNLRMLEEGLSKEEVTDRVIEENLHGLEIDPRCTQIAAFNLALTAWRFCGRYKELPGMNLACSGLAPKGKKEDWIKLVGKVERTDDKARMENGMSMLFNHFQLAPELGSLLDPTTVKADLHTASFDQLYPVLKEALESEVDKDIVERGVMAAGIAKAGIILSNKYWLVITNVPYLKSGNQHATLKSYCENNFPKSKYDLATVFLDKFIISLYPHGAISIVTQQYWLFLKFYTKLREKFIKNYELGLIVRLGPGAFETISGEVVNVCLQINFKSNPSSRYQHCGIEVDSVLGIDNKKAGLTKFPIKTILQYSQLTNPDKRILFENLNEAGSSSLSDYADYGKGSVSGDSFKYLRKFWEFESLNRNILKWLNSPSNTDYWKGRENVIIWDDEGFNPENEIGFAFRGERVLGKKGVAVSKAGNIKVTLYDGELFDDNLAVIVPKSAENLNAIWKYSVSEFFYNDLRKLDKKMAITAGTFTKVPFDLLKWQKNVSEDPLTDLSLPFSDDATQWLFHGHPKKSDNPLHIGVLRLLGYRWPAESDIEMKLTDNATVLIGEIKKHDYLSDNDGIICIPSVNVEETGASRLRNYMKEVFGEAWKTSTIQQILEKENATSSNIENWLRNEFFIQHCKIFHNRPFIWHIWDGRSDGFSALVNYHKLDKVNLSKLIYTYLGDWIRMCESKKKIGESGAEGLLSAAIKLKEKLELILEGETPYDIFVRWKPLEQQPIGWDPDLNDGVRLNIRPFIEADVLRKRPNIKWGIDRGKNPPGSPWGEIRDNDRHLTLAEKKAAREKL
jgi:hypothetical protein